MKEVFFLVKRELKHVKMKMTLAITIANPLVITSNLSCVGWLHVNDTLYYCTLMSHNRALFPSFLTDQQIMFMPNRTVLFHTTRLTPLQTTSTNKAAATVKVQVAA